MKIVLFLIMVCINAGILFTGFINVIRLGMRALRKEETAHLKTILCKNGILLAIVVLLSAALILLTQMTAHTTKITDTDGNEIQGSISELISIEVNGHKEWISIRGTDRSNPILLFLAGGPGGTQLAASRYSLSALEDEFVVVNWDQPGSGKSYNCMKRSEITVDTYIEDGKAVTEYLCKRFGREKIFLLGESWGSALGIFLVKDAPELYAGFIGTGQMVDFAETEALDYEKAIEILSEKGNTKAVKQLEEQGPPLYEEGNIALKSQKYLGVLSDEMAMNPNITNGGYQTFRDMFSEEYGILDSIHFMLGVMNTFNVVYPQLYDVDLREAYTKIEVPVYFFEGQYDINAPIELVNEYYGLLDCPEKELVWFEHSGHSPWINESDKFVEQVIRILKK